MRTIEAQAERATTLGRRKPWDVRTVDGEVRVYGSPKGADSLSHAQELLKDFMLAPAEVQRDARGSYVAVSGYDPKLVQGRIVQLRATRERHQQQMSERILRVIDLAIGQRDYSMPVERKKFVRRVFEVLADFAHAPLGAHGRTAQESDLPLDMSELSVIHDRELYAWDEHQILMCAGTIDVLRAAFRSQDAAIEASVNAGSMGVETTLDAAIDAIRPKVDELVSNVSAASIDYARSKTFGAYVGKTEELGAQVSPSAEPVGRTL